MQDSLAALPPTVLISYSHDSQEHLDRVLAFANRLRTDGVDATIDQYEVSPPEGWPIWMERQVRESDFILVICSETYLKRAERREEPGKGHGVVWESVLTYQQIYDAGSKNEKFIPVLLEAGKRSDIPMPLRSATYYECATEEGYRDLYARLTGQHGKSKPKLGKLKPLPPRENKQQQGRTLIMKQTMKLTDAELGMLDTVVSRFLSEKKPTPRRQLVVRFQEPGLLETLVQRSLLRDLSMQDFLPTLLSFEFCSDEQALTFAKESVATVLHALRALFLKYEEDRMFTVEEIETQARILGKSVVPSTIWLGLYFAEEFGVLGGWGTSDNPTVKTSVRVSEWILKQKDMDKAWDNLLEQRIQWQIQRESYNSAANNPATNLLELEDDSDIFNTPISSTTMALNSTAAKDPALQVFISHSSKDGEIALSLIELLRSALPLKDEQIRCTSVDGFRLSAGANVDDDLKTEVLDAKTFIGLITPNSLGSAYVLFELGARWGARRHMIPILAGLTPATLEGPLKAINAISASNINQLHQLVSDLADALDLEVQRAATYTRYAEKLIRQIGGIFGSFERFSPKPQPPSPNANSASGQPGSERKLTVLTRDAVIAASKYFRWNKQLPKWTVVVDGTAFPVRPLAFKAAGLLPNDAATTHQAVAKLKQLGFQVFYEGKPA